MSKNKTEKTKTFCSYTARERMEMTIAAIETSIKILNTALYFNTQAPSAKSTKLVLNASKLLNGLTKGFYKKCKSGF